MRVVPRNRDYEIARYVECEKLKRKVFSAGLESASAAEEIAPGGGMSLTLQQEQELQLPSAWEQQELGVEC